MPRTERHPPVRGILAAALSIVLFLPAFASAEVHRVEDAITGWWWYSGVTEAELNGFVEEHDARIIDIEVRDTEPFTFAATLVRNSGVYQTGWWWYYGLTFEEIGDYLERNDARLIDLERYIGPTGAARYAVVMVPNTGDQQKAWWYYIGVTPDEISDYVERNEARLVDIESWDTAGAGRLFGVIMIANTGQDAAPWGWYHNVDRQTMVDYMSENNMRLLEFEVREQSGEARFDAVMVSLGHHTPKTWWWYYGIPFSEVGPLASQAASRITDLDTYVIGGQRYYNVVMLSNATDLTVEMGQILEWGSDGNTGAYLRRLDGSTDASLNPDFIFEPASTIKAVHHLHTMRDVMNGGADLSDPVTYSENYNGSCPIGGAPFTTVTLQETLRRMMVNSDNAATNGIAGLYGMAAIEATAQNIAGMTSTEVNHTLGCGAAAVANPNRLTLRDVGRLYEGVQDLTLLDAEHRDLYYSLMQNRTTPGPWWFTTDLRATVEEEAAALGAPDIADVFWANVDLAWKPGGYTLIFDGTNHEYISVGGIVSLPTCGNWPAIDYRHYVFGVFVDDGSNNADTFARVREAAKELMRDAVADAMGACPTSVEHALPAVASLLEPNFPNPFNPSTTLIYNLPRAGDANLTIYDAAGRAVAELVAGDHAAGRHQVVWDGRDQGGRLVPAGIYLAKLQAAGLVETRKLALIK